MSGTAAGSAVVSGGRCSTCDVELSGPYCHQCGEAHPGALENMQKTLCTRLVGTHLIDGAGHWVQQEQPEAVTRLLLPFLKQTSG